jgi:predicted TIM-barrel fold metal-dependent hydrolase
MPSRQTFEKIRVIDVDTHVTEPEDLWTSRVARKWGSLVPHVVRDPSGGPKEFWAIGDEIIAPTGVASMAGFDGTLPDHPATVRDGPAAAYDAKARLAHMDQEKIWAQVIYPNVGGFGSGRFLRLGEPALMLECVRAYNDFLSEWCSADPQRLVAVMATPFWDVKETVREIERCAARGHRGVLFGGSPQSFGQPGLASRHWDPIWASAQDAGLPISFHIGASAAGATSIVPQNPFGPAVPDGFAVRAGLAKLATMFFLENSQCIGDVICGGVCHRFPRLNFVSVESGIGWLPFVIEALDWQWKNNGVLRESPELDLLPSEYFRRQIYGCFWFEEDCARSAIERFPDNILYETDYPHPTSMSPGPQSAAEHPADYVERVWSGIPQRVLRAVLHDNAARVYRLD